MICSSEIERESIVIKSSAEKRKKVTKNWTKISNFCKNELKHDHTEIEQKLKVTRELREHRMSLRNWKKIKWYTEIDSITQKLSENIILLRNWVKLECLSENDRTTNVTNKLREKSNFPRKLSKNWISLRNELKIKFSSVSEQKLLVIIYYKNWNITRKLYSHPKIERTSNVIKNVIHEWAENQMSPRNLANIECHSEIERRSNITQKLSEYRMSLRNGESEQKSNVTQEWVENRNFKRN